MYLDEFSIALLFIEKSLNGSGRGIRSYVILHEIFRVSSEETANGRQSPL